MSRDDIQKLLGGYATGTLTHEEQRALYEAALTDQELFDALAREEALRDVLSDPAARAHLLAAIDETPEPWFRRWWRPLLVMGSAAALVVAMAVYLRPERPPDLAKVELPKFRPPAPAQNIPMLPPAPETRRAQPVLKDLSIQLPEPKPVPPPPPARALAAAAQQAQQQRDSFVIDGTSRADGPRQQVQTQFGPAAPPLNRMFQAGMVSLNGTVTDATGATIPAADVLVKSAATGETFRTTTDEKGQFTASQAPGDKLEISASKRGFKQTTVSEVTPANGTPAPVNLKLDAAATNETVEVTAQPAAPLPATRAAAGRAGAVGGALSAEMKKAKVAAAPAPVLQYQLLQKQSGRQRTEVHADGAVPAGTALILRVTPMADGYLRVVDGERTIATPKVRRGAASDIDLGTFDKPGRVELQVYFSRDVAMAAVAKDETAVPTMTLSFNVQ